MNAVEALFVMNKIELNWRLEQILAWTDMVYSNSIQVPASSISEQSSRMVLELCWSISVAGTDVYPGGERDSESKRRESESKR